MPLCCLLHSLSLSCCLSSAVDECPLLELRVLPRKLPITLWSCSHLPISMPASCFELPEMLSLSTPSPRSSLVNTGDLIWVLGIIFFYMVCCNFLTQLLIWLNSTPEADPGMPKIRRACERGVCCHCCRPWLDLKDGHISALSARGCDTDGFGRWMRQDAILNTSA